MMVVWTKVDILEGMERKKKEEGNFRLRGKGQKNRTEIPSNSLPR